MSKIGVENPHEPRHPFKLNLDEIKTVADVTEVLAALDPRFSEAAISGAPSKYFLSTDPAKQPTTATAKKKAAPKKKAAAKKA